MGKWTKVMKKGMKATKKSGESMKKEAIKKSIIARGKHAKISVFRGTKKRTGGGLKKDALIKSKSGKIVSKKQSLPGKASNKKNGIAKWNAAAMRARKDLTSLEGPRGKALLAKL